MRFTDRVERAEAVARETSIAAACGPRMAGYPLTADELPVESRDPDGA
jgi:hypothetical protein